MERPLVISNQQNQLSVQCKFLLQRNLRKKEKQTVTLRRRLSFLSCIYKDSAPVGLFSKSYQLESFKIPVLESF